MHWTALSRVGRGAPARRMSAPRSDAFVFFGATGDLAYKKIFPALQAMIRRGHLDVPVIGVAKAGWTLEQLRARARDEPRASTAAASTRRPSRSSWRCCATSTATTTTRRPSPRCARSSAAPRDRCTTWRSRRACSRSWSRASAVAAARTDARVIVEKPFGRDLAVGARAQRDPAHSVFDESAVFRIDHYLGKEAGAEPALLPLRQHVPRADLEPQLRRERADHDGRELRRRRAAAGSTRRPARSATWCRTTCCRWSGFLAMEPPATTYHEADPRRAGEGVPRRSRPLDARPTSCAASSAATGTSPASRPTRTVETFAAVRLDIDSWRWDGVPFFIRAGKCLPVTRPR